ncbi:MAG: RDD family protein [Nitrospirae bacterium]|nr:RDD family protein [Nitrospirota bacterium]
MEQARQEPLSPETANPWPLFPEQPIKAPTAVELAAVSVKDKAGFWRRMAAFIIDMMLLEWITLLFVWIGSAAEDLALAHIVNEDLSGAVLEWAAMHTEVSTFLFIVYFSFFTFYGGQTPGKMALGICVITTDGLPVSWLRAIGRTICYNLDIFTLGVGFLLAAIPPAKRALHDLIAGTVVVKVQPK